jgi:hypothetical protein
MTPGPIFVGGTGRSGTTVLGQLLGHHADVIRVVPTEVRVFTDKRGLIDLLAAERAAREPNLFRRLILRRRRRPPPKGALVPRKFVESFRTRFYATTARDGLPRGLQLSGKELSAFEPLLVGFEKRIRRRPLEESRRFANGLMRILAGGDSRWVETTPGNAARADRLLELFPDMYLLHVVRDGRDTAASIATMIWGPHDIFEALDWWGERMRDAYTALEAIPRQRALTIRLEDLLVRDRDSSYERVRTGLALPPDEGMREFFDGMMTPERGHLGRWRSQLDDHDAVVRFDRRYREHLTELRERFGPVPPTEDLEELPVSS